MSIFNFNFQENQNPKKCNCINHSSEIFIVKPNLFFRPYANSKSEKWSSSWPGQDVEVLLHLTGTLAPAGHLHTSIALSIACVVIGQPVTAAHRVIVLRTGAAPQPRPGGGGGGAGVVWICYWHCISSCDVILKVWPGMRMQGVSM